MSLFDQYNWQGQRGFPYFWGYYWIGPVQIPALPPVFGMTDRNALATIWYPTVTNDGTHIQFSTTKPGPNAPVRVYGPYDGPFVGQWQLRLGILNGHLVVDAFNNEGPGPFLRGTSDITIAAVIFAISSSHAGNIIADHLTFQSAPVKGSIFDPTP